jgi:selenide,water dikinase
VLPGALELAREGVLAGGTRANRAYAEPWLTVGAGTDEGLAWLAVDAQTSGGLLLALPPEEAQTLADALVAKGHPAAVVGAITPGEPRVTLTP